MNKELLKMQKLAGIITEGQYKKEVNEMEGDPLEYSGYNEPYDHSVEADDPAGHDKVAFLADAFQYVWSMGKGNNTIDFDKMAKSTIEDLETRF